MAPRAQGTRTLGRYSITVHCVPPRKGGGEEGGWGGSSRENSRTFLDESVHNTDESVHNTDESVHNTGESVHNTFISFTWE